MTRRGFGAAGTAAIGVAIVLVYGRVTGFFFTDVDTLPLIATGRVASWSDFVDVMTSPLMGGQMPNALFYRPLASLSWGLDWALWGDVAAGYHVTDIALHGANALLLFGWLRSLGQDPSPGAPSDSAVSRGDIEALLAALLFAVHPLTMETVPAIARRPDLLFCLFLLLLSLLLIPTYRYTCLPANLPTWLPTYLPNYLPPDLSTHLRTYLPIYISIHLPSYLP